MGDNETLKRDASDVLFMCTHETEVYWEVTKRGGRGRERDGGPLHADDGCGVH